jgi:hypothetical protein
MEAGRGRLGAFLLFVAIRVAWVDSGPSQSENRCEAVTVFLLPDSAPRFPSFTAGQQRMISSQLAEVKLTGFPSSRILGQPVLETVRAPFFVTRTRCTVEPHSRIGPDWALICVRRSRRQFSLLPQLLWFAVRSTPCGAEPLYRTHFSQKAPLRKISRLFLFALLPQSSPPANTDFELALTVDSERIAAHKRQSLEGSL